MKTVFSFMLCLLPAVCAQAQSPVLARASLESATVFSRGAELAHVVNAALPAGTSEMVIGGVASRLDEKSLQIGTPEGVNILSARTAKNYLNRSPESPAYSRLEDSLKLARRTLMETQNLRLAEESTLALLEKNQSVGGSNGSVTVTELQNMVAFYKKQHIETRNRMLRLAEQESEQEKQVARLERQLEELKSRGSVAGGQLVLQLMSERTVKAGFTIRYITPAAGWEAYYDLRASGTDAPLSIVYKARVTQNTGLAWENVMLTLSTGNPSQGGAIPELNPWFLRFRQPLSALQDQAKELQRLEEAELDEVVVAGKGKRDKALEPVAALDDYTVQEEHQLSATFKIDVPYDIASNGKPHSVALKSFTHPASFRYYAAPKSDPDAFLLAEVTGYGKLNLLPGQANIIFENMYVGKSYIDPYATDDTLRLGMGRDKMVAINRERVDEQTHTQTVGGQKNQTFTYETKIRNNKSRTIALSLEDQYPLPTDKDIRIELLEAKGARVNRETGLLTWELDIPPGQTKTLRMSYRVRYPKNKSLANL